MKKCYKEIERAPRVTVVHWGLFPRNCINTKNENQYYYYVRKSLDFVTGQGDKNN